MITTPDRVKLLVETGNTSKLHFTACKVMSRDGSCTSPGVVLHCLPQGQNAGPSLRQDQWVLKGKAVRGALKGKAAGSHPPVTPSPPQGVTVGAVRVSPPQAGNTGLWC